MTASPPYPFPRIQTMSSTEHIIQPYIATIEPEGHKLHVSCRISFDGIEYVGRLWFADDAWEDSGIPDRGALPGRSHDEVIALAKRLSPTELTLRYRRALAEKRRAVQAGRRRDDAEVFRRFPLRLVPTYPGDDRLDGPFFAPFFDHAPPLVRATLADIFEGGG